MMSTFDHKPSFSWILYCCWMMTSSSSHCCIVLILSETTSFWARLWLYLRYSWASLRIFVLASWAQHFFWTLWDFFLLQMQDLGAQVQLFSEFHHNVHLSSQS